MTKNGSFRSGRKAKKLAFLIGQTISFPEPIISLSFQSNLAIPNVHFCAAQLQEARSGLSQGPKWAWYSQRFRIIGKI